MSYELRDLHTEFSEWDEARKKWEKNLRIIYWFTIVAFFIVWLVAKKGVDATDTQLLCAIVSVATIALLTVIGWGGYIVACVLGNVGMKIEKLAHVITEKSPDDAGEYS